MPSRLVLTAWRFSPARDAVLVPVALTLTLVLALACSGARAEEPAPATPAERLHVGSAMHGAAGVRIEEDGEGRAVHVGRLDPDGLAARAGVRRGDRIVTLNGCRVRPAADVAAALDSALPGASVEIGILRPMPTGPAQYLRLLLPGPEIAPTAVWAGLSLADGTPGARILVPSSGITPPLQVGDVILAIDAMPVADASAAHALLAGRPRAHEFTLRRAGRQVVLAVAIGAAAGGAAVRPPDAPCTP